MGMSASQARFLALTARKSNVEYQGQQVNQQRTSLANESAGIYNQMLDLVVPTPPSALDYYSMAYTFAGTAENTSCRIVNWAPSSNTELGPYDIEIKETINDTGEKAPKLPSESKIYTTDKEGVYQLYFFEGKDENGENIYSKFEISKSTKDVKGKKDGDEGYIKSYSFIKGGRTMFISADELEAVIASAISSEGGAKFVTLDDNNTVTAAYYKGEPTVEYKTYVGASLETDETGRFISMTYCPTGQVGDDKITVELNITEINDEEGYSRALEEYNYKKMVYDRTMDDFNNRTAIIQQQDKKLELALKQLDTEQNAIKTEMDAVKEVLKKNVEETFKTFNA